MVSRTTTHSFGTRAALLWLLCSFFAAFLLVGRHQALGGGRHQTFWRFSPAAQSSPTKHPLSPSLAFRAQPAFCQSETLFQHSVITIHELTIDIYPFLLLIIQFETKLLDQMFCSYIHHTAILSLSCIDHYDDDHHQDQDVS